MDALPFATTKIQPPRGRRTRVERPALDAAITEAVLDCRVVLLQAPAGFGKTSLLSAQLARLPAGTAQAWVSLDADDDPQRLFACLVAALEPHDLPWRTAPEALVAMVAVDAQQADAGAGMRRAVAELINALAACDAPRGVIVLDDLHRVTAAPTAALLDALIERLPPRWTLVIASRVAPPLALARLRVAGELAEFTQAQLRFGAAEAQALAGAEAQPATREQVAELLARTQGWPAGLSLGLAALRTRGSAAGLGTTTLMDRHLFDYLASEVLDDMPAPLHDFLVRCAVLPELTAGRAAAVSADPLAAQHLDEIERRALFVTALEASERTLVLHDLFRDALQQRLARRFPTELPALLRRAAAGEADPLRRVGYLLRAADWAAAEAALVESAPELFLSGGSGEVQRLIEQFPPDWRGASPRLLRLAGIGCCLRWQWTEMARCMQEAETAAAGDAAERTLAQAYLALASYPLGRDTHSEALIARLKEHAATPGGTLGADAQRVMLMADAAQHFRRGDHAALPAVYAQVLQSLEAGAPLYAWWECVPATNWSTIRGMRALLSRYADGAFARLGERALPMRGEVQLLRAYLRLWSGQLDAAATEARSAEADMQWLACSAEMEVGVETFRMIEAAMRGDAQAVYRRLDALYTREDSATDERRALWQHQMAVYGVRLSDVLGGDPAALAHWAARLFERPLIDPTPITARAVAARARYAAAQGRWHDAAALFDHLLPRSNNMDVNGQAIELQLRCAHARLRCDRVAEAAAAAAPALDRMRLEDERGHALMCGSALLGTLASARWGGLLSSEQLGELQAASALAASVRIAAPQGAGAAAPQSASDAVVAAAAAAQLSTREREVLARIGAGDSNKLIARALDISPHTVKRHVANILDKLGLASRGQAGAWLRENA
ncbi:MAG: LuxR C-terminal-related transcriptional regulator [Pseudomonadota bacterium]